MSIKVMTLVWDRYQGSGSELLAMLALANWCNDDGGSLYPSIKQLALKMRVSRSQAQRVLHNLMPANDEALAKGDWFVRVIGNEKGGAPGTTRQYQLNVKRLVSLPEIGSETGSVDATGSTGATGRMDAQDGPHGCDGTGSMGATQYVIEPLLNRQSLQSAPANDFEEWWKAYPHKVAKADAKRAFEKALRKASSQTLLDGVGRYIVTKPHDRPYCNPATWLNGERWLDQPISSNVPQQGASKLTSVSGYAREQLALRERQRIEGNAITSA